mgnify:CR=1 FL=1
MSSYQIAVVRGDGIGPEVCDAAVKVVTEANVVFLLGIVTRAEADAAAEIARTSKGVSKVVRVFEYVSDEEARRLDNPTSARK